VTTVYKKTEVFSILLTFFFIFAIALHFGFYFSAFKTYSLNKFFLPVTPGQDFFQIPNGAYSFLHGGDFQGNIDGTKNAYTNCCGVNDNVYHPLFTLLVGTPLQFFSPWSAFYLWSFTHILVDIFIILFLVKKFKKNQYLVLALVVFLVSSFGYYEIWNNQYHFLLNFAVFLLVYEIATKGDTLKSGFYFFFSLLVKPIGVLWIVPLFVKKQFKTLSLGLGLFSVTTFPFWFLPQSQYYFQNIKNALENIYADWNIFFVLNFIGINVQNLTFIKNSVAFLLLLLSFSSKFSSPSLIMLWILFTLIFYPATFPYHFSILTFIVPLMILLKEIYLGFLEKVGIFFIIVPAPIVLLRILGEKGFIENNHILEKFTFISWSLAATILFSIAIFWKKAEKAKQGK